MSKDVMLKFVPFEKYESEVNRYVEVIRELKEELKRERFAVDFYASQELYKKERQDIFKTYNPAPIEIDQGVYARNLQGMRKVIV